MCCYATNAKILQECCNNSALGMRLLRRTKSCFEFPLMRLGSRRVPASRPGTELTEVCGSARGPDADRRRGLVSRALKINRLGSVSLGAPGSKFDQYAQRVR